MKKIVSILVIVLFVMVHVTAMAGSTVTAATSYNPDQYTNYKNKVIKITIADEASPVAAVTTTLSETDVLGYFLCSMETVPGSTAPTNDFDITLSTAGGFDILNGAGANLDSPTPNVVYPTIDSTTGQKGCVPVNSALTLSFSGNSVANATATINFFFTRP